MDRPRDHYRALGLTPTADPRDVREAYLNLARILHPDRRGDATDAERALAERRMREVNEAWSVLRDPVTRARHDDERARRGDAARRESDAAAPQRRGAGGPATRFPDDAPEHDVDDLPVGDAPFHLATMLPWLLLAAAALVIFVFSAYAKAPATQPVTPATAPPASPATAPPASSWPAQLGG